MGCLLSICPGSEQPQPKKRNYLGTPMPETPPHYKKSNKPPPTPPSAYYGSFMNKVNAGDTYSHNNNMSEEGVGLISGSVKSGGGGGYRNQNQGQQGKNNYQQQSQQQSHQQYNNNTSSEVRTQKAPTPQKNQNTQQPKQQQQQIPQPSQIQQPKHTPTPITSPQKPTATPVQTPTVSLSSSTPPRKSSTSPGLLADKYSIKEVLGLGSTSTCHRITSLETGVDYACKVIDKRHIETRFRGLLTQFNVEIDVLLQLNHPNIIKLVDVYITNEKIYMIMELMLGGELFDYVVEKGTLLESEASSIVGMVCSAVEYMHGMGIIHRDMKPENLLLVNRPVNGDVPVVKIIDFGLSKLLSGTGTAEDEVANPNSGKLGLNNVSAFFPPNLSGDGSNNNNNNVNGINLNANIQQQIPIPPMKSQMAASFLGTRGYLAPELLKRELYSKEVDIWALGVIVFVLVCGCLPFDDDSSKIYSTQSELKTKFTLRFPKWSRNLSDNAKDLLSHLLDTDTKKRYTAKQALDHPWVRGVGVKAKNYLQSPRIIGTPSRVNGNSTNSGAAGGAGVYKERVEESRRVEGYEGYSSNNGQNKGKGGGGGYGGGGGSGGRRKNSI